jgi:hypothetical protein
VNGEPLVDVDAIFAHWLDTDVVAGRAWVHDPFQHALIRQARGVLHEVDVAMRAAGIDLDTRTTVLSEAFTQITDRSQAGQIDYHL